MKKIFIALCIIGFMSSSCLAAEGSKAKPSPRAVERASPMASFKRTESPSAKARGKEISKKAKVKAVKK